MAAHPPGGDPASFLMIFGTARFTLRDYWRRKLRRSGFPFPHEAKAIADQLDGLPCLEPAPGPRGGQGWRVSPAAIEALGQARERAAAALTSRYAAVELVEDEYRIRVTYPDLALPPTWERFPFGLKDQRLGALIHAWIRRRRFKGIDARGTAGVLLCEWRHAAKMARVIDQLDSLVERHIEAAARHHRDRLAALEPWLHRTATPNDTENQHGR